MAVGGAVLYMVLPVSVTITGLALLWYRFPHLLLLGLFRWALYSCGLRLKKVTAGHYTYCYAERGKPHPTKSTILLVHGFSASKDMWVPIVKRLPQGLHIVVVDLPGHGGTTTPHPHHSISLVKYSDYLNEFVMAAGLDKRPFHLVGTSLGGAIAACYAARFPEHLCLLSLNCPAVQTPVENQFLCELRSGYCRLIPESTDDMQKMLDSVWYKKQKLSKQFLQGALKLRQPRNEFYRRLFFELTKEIDNNSMTDLINKIHTPVQLVWGQQDQLVDVASAEHLKKMLPNCVRVDIIDRCGHSINMDRPGMATKMLMQFREEM